MNKTIIQDSSLSKVDEIASSGNFTIQLIKRLGEKDYDPLIEISHSLAEEYGKKYILNDNTIEKYFNREGSLPIIARFQKKNHWIYHRHAFRASISRTMVSAR